MNLFKMCGPQIQFCLFTFRPIASEQLNSLTTIVTLSWLGGRKVTLQTVVQEVLGSIPGSGKGFMLAFLFRWCCVFTFCPKNTLFVTQLCSFFCKVNLFVILNILQNLWPIIRVKRYRPSVFKKVCFYHVFLNFNFVSVNFDDHNGNKILSYLK